MAHLRTQTNSSKYSCSVCLDLLKDPVTIPCGHSYCMDCIKNVWDGEDQRRTYSCPQCRETFRTRPVLKKNIMLAELVEDLKRTGLQAAADDHCYVGTTDVACDVCVGTKMKAVKSCLVCSASYCDSHLQPHFEVPAMKQHKLMNPSKMLQENPSSPRSLIQAKITDKMKEVKLLQQEVEAINVSADKAVEDSEKIYNELIHHIQKRSSDVKQQIRSQQEAEVSRLKELQEQLEQEITELKRKEAELEKLSNTEDLNQFLQNYPSLSALSESTHSSSITIHPPRYFEDVTATVSEIRGKVEDILRDTWANILLTVMEVEVLLSEPEPTTRSELLKYSCEITLNPNTANRNLILSEGNRKVTYKEVKQPYPDHPDRFTDYNQILSRESLTGRCYWEVEWKGDGVYVAVSYRNISRTGKLADSKFGLNENSWLLFCCKRFFKFFHNSNEKRFFIPVSSRVGVYLDHRAGILSFYSVSETLTLLHRVQTRFTQPLYAGTGFGVHDTAKPYGGSSAEFLKLK
ncbi:PREDICTED: tripartite motif-containing protein 16-like protein [Cyprinodon variegatus]|uniref:tripartite motif-containing protein 16-like protein n=1 Tax=Cyprinodon variegatus TaxID=28743 RepID=UPI0007426B50|nr:PREDICTED: tripartite motif-containing protein 16-like protein [Cyprinodon variegatus]